MDIGLSANAGCERYDLVPLGQEERVVANDEPFGSSACLAGLGKNSIGPSMDLLHLLKLTRTVNVPLFGGVWSNHRVSPGLKSQGPHPQTAGSRTIPLVFDRAELAVAAGSLAQLRAPNAPTPAPSLGEMSDRYCHRQGVRDPVTLLCEMSTLVCSAGHEYRNEHPSDAGSLYLMRCAQKPHHFIAQALRITFAFFCDVDCRPGNQQHNWIFAVHEP
jgi:hypothetical protein